VVGFRHGSAVILSVALLLGVLLHLVLALAVVITWSPVWIASSFLAASPRLGHLPTAAAIALALGGMVVLWFQARRLERLSRNPLSRLRRFLRLASAESEPAEAAPSPLKATAAGNR